MTWLVDLGNTRLKWARLDAGGALAERGAVAHMDADFEPAFDAALAALPRADRAVLASVAGADLTARVIALIGRHGVPCERAQTHAEFAGLRIAYAEPARLGVDRFLAMLGARARGDGPWLIAGIGTALTVDAVAADGHHLGGVIAPSPTLMRAALAERALQLDVTGGEASAFASDTADALASGCLGAAVALIERSQALASRAFGAEPGLLLTGGGAAVLLPLLAIAHEHAPDLVLEGLARYAVQGTEDRGQKTEDRR